MNGNQSGKTQVRIITGVYLFLGCSGLGLALAAMGTGAKRGLLALLIPSIISALVLVVFLKGSQIAKQILGILLFLLGSTILVFVLPIISLFILPILTEGHLDFSEFGELMAWLGAGSTSQIVVLYLLMWYAFAAGLSSVACGSLLMFSKSLRTEMARRSEIRS